MLIDNRDINLLLRFLIGNISHVFIAHAQTPNTCKTKIITAGFNVYSKLHAGFNVYSKLHALTSRQSLTVLKI